MAAFAATDLSKGVRSTHATSCGRTAFLKNDKIYLDLFPLRYLTTQVFKLRRPDLHAEVTIPASQPSLSNKANLQLLSLASSLELTPYSCPVVDQKSRKLVQLTQFVQPEAEGFRGPLLFHSLCGIRQIVKLIDKIPDTAKGITE